MEDALSNSSNALFEDITDGKKDDGMPAYKNKLSKGEQWNVIEYIWTFIYQD